MCPYYIRTGMVNPLINTPWYKPILDPEWACRRIINALRQQEAFVVIPWRFNILLLLKTVLPECLFDELAGFLPLT